MSQPFDFDKALKALQSGQALTGKDGILTPLIKQLTEAALAAELDSHLAQDVEANRKNGSGKKAVKTPTGGFELATPRDCNGTFEPQLVKKHQTSDEIERKIIRMFALGMSYKDISQERQVSPILSLSCKAMQPVSDENVSVRGRNGSGKDFPTAGASGLLTNVYDRRRQQFLSVFNFLWFWIVNS